jgi:hydroxyacylglutathione hydrolase
MLQIKVFSFSPLAENTYVLYNEHKEAAIFDPGCFTGDEFEELSAFITNLQLKPIHLLNTHCHFDHVFGEKQVAEKWHLTPQFHELERPVMEFAAKAAMKWNLPFDPYLGDSLPLVDHQEIAIGEDHLKVHFAPGHSPGHVFFHHEKQSFVIGGDILFRDSIGRTDLPGGDHQLLLTSIKERMYTLPPQTKVYPGHGPYTTIQYEMAHNPFVHI